MVKIVKMIGLMCVFMCGLMFCSFTLNQKSNNLRMGEVESNIDQSAFADEINVGSYAKVLNGCKLFRNKEMVDGFDSVLFYIPETYFVVILEVLNDNCFKVQYDRFIGYIDSSFVTLAMFTPIVKTLSNITVDIKESSGTKIWQYPTTKSNEYTSILAGTKNIIYIASTEGVIPSGGQSNVWYYVQYVPDNNSTNVYEGYIYSENTVNLSPIVSNLESNPEVISDEWKNENILFISSTLKTIIIAVIAIPIILFFAIILYKLTKRFNKNTKYNKNSITTDVNNIDESLKQENIKAFEKFKNLKLVKNKKVEINYANLDDDELL